MIIPHPIWAFVRLGPSHLPPISASLCNFKSFISKCSSLAILMVWFFFWLDWSAGKTFHKGCGEKWIGKPFDPEDEGIGGINVTNVACSKIFTKKKKRKKEEFQSVWPRARFASKILRTLQGFSSLDFRNANWKRPSTMHTHTHTHTGTSSSTKLNKLCYILFKVYKGRFR